WIEETFDETPSRLCDRDFIQTQIIDQRVADVKKKKPFEWNTFQEHCEALRDRALLLAPCGSGKTLAAWRWIVSRLKEPVKRVIFLYPTRATAKEGFRDYVSWAPDADAGLVHGTA